MKQHFLTAVMAVWAVALTAGLPSCTSAPDDVNSTGNDMGLSGKVVETMDSSGYTYACIEKKGEKIWVAIPQAEIELGATIAFAPGMPMHNFKSKTLNRTFDTIIFSEGVIK